MNLLRYVFSVIVLTALVACGGGGGNPGTSSGAPLPSVVAPASTFALQIFNSSNVAVANITASGGNYAKATFKDGTGAPIAGRLVSFSVNSDIATLVSATALTNSVGEAQIGILSAKVGAATLQAQVINGTGTLTASFDFAVVSTGGPVGTSIAVQLFNAANAAVSNVTYGGGNYVKATFKDAAGVPIANRKVTFSVTSNIATLAATTALTNAAGEAQVGLYPSVGAMAGAATLQAQAVDGTTTFTGTLDFAVAATGLPISPYMAVQIFNSANAAVSNVTFGGGNYVKATFKDASNVPIAGRTVSFTLNGAGIALVSPTTALTNSLGEAQVSIAPASISTVGAATLTAQALDAGSTYSVSMDFAVAAANVTLGQLTLGSSSLSAGGNTSVTITAQSNSIPVAGVNVSLTADCGTIANVVTTDGSGSASATYSAVKAGGSSCSGAVTLSASAAGSASQKATLIIAAPVANAINFVSATPSQIFVKSSGAAEQSVAQFKVLDSTGAAMPNIPVVFSLTVNPGGVGLGASGTPGNVTANSDALGIASVSVFSGTIPGPVEVKAALVSAPTVFTTSKNLTVASGPPSQNHLSLSVETFNIEGWNLDGSGTKLTVRVADRQGNPVPDGTVINFTAEGGQVAPSCATARDASGHAVCSVAFISQNPRPADGRVSVLAYAEGLKEYIDVNGNNAYDPGIDTLVDLGDAYRDDNESGQYDVGEFVIPKGGTVACAGAGGASPARANTCTGGATQATTVRQQAVILFASSSASLTLTTAATPVSPTFITVRVNSADHSLLPMPAGTTISVTGSGATCVIGTITPSIVPNISGAAGLQLGSSHSIPLTGCGGTTIFIKAASPSGLVTSFSYDVPAVPTCTAPQTMQNGVCVSPPDTTPPIFTSTPAIDQVVSTLPTSARLTAMLNEAGTGYYKVVAGNPPPAGSVPSAAALLLTGSQIAMPANTPVSATLTGLTAGTAYTVYFVARDSAGNTQATVSTVTFTQ